MTIDYKIKNEKLQYNINREAAKISALSSSKIDRYEYLTGEEILSPDQSRIIEQARFTYSPLKKPLEKQTKTIEDQGNNLNNKKELSNNELLLSKDFKFIVNSNGLETSFNELKDPVVFLDILKDVKYR